MAKNQDRCYAVKKLLPAKRRVVSNFLAASTFVLKRVIVGVALPAKETLHECDSVRVATRLLSLCWVVDNEPVVQKRCLPAKICANAFCPAENTSA